VLARTVTRSPFGGWNRRSGHDRTAEDAGDRGHVSTHTREDAVFQTDCASFGNPGETCLLSPASPAKRYRYRSPRSAWRLLLVCHFDGTPAIWASARRRLGGPKDWRNRLRSRVAGGNATQMTIGVRAPKACPLPSRSSSVRRILQSPSPALRWAKRPSAIDAASSKFQATRVVAEGKSSMNWRSEDCRRPRFRAASAHRRRPARGVSAERRGGLSVTPMSRSPTDRPNCRYQSPSSSAGHGLRRRRSRRYASQQQRCSATTRFMPVIGRVAGAEPTPPMMVRPLIPLAVPVAEASLRFGLAVPWIQAVMSAQTSAICTLSPKNAIGLMQIMKEPWSI
jgi:hypothetical protein